MSRNNLSALLLAALLMLFWHAPASASRRAECHKTQGQTRAAAKLKQGQFVRIRTASGLEVSGHFRSFDGSRLVLEDKHNHRVVTVESADIVQIKSGRGFLGSLRHGFSESARVLAKPVTDWIVAYQKMDAMGDLMR